jgi:pimeloyl-ACP methyl ester carboxylesterase
LLRILLTVVLCASSASIARAGTETDNLATIADGRRLHVSCAGEGAPTIILESGLGLPMTSWIKVKARLAAHHRVCTYERAGYGSSDPGPMPRDAEHVAADLAALAKAEGFQPPYVLVGHSLGAHFVRLFAAEHPRDVRGLVLVDPIFQDNDAKLTAASASAAAAIAQDNRTIEKCVGALAEGRFWNATDPEYVACGPPPPPRSPMASATLARATLSEFKNREVSADQVARATRRAAAPPMIILTASGKRTAPLSDVQDVLTREHTAIAHTSKRGVDRIVEDSGHVIQYDKPEAVVQAVDDVIGIDPTWR